MERPLSTPKLQTKRGNSGSSESHAPKKKIVAATTKRTQEVMIANPVRLYQQWSPASHLALMDSLSIRKSIISISAPGTHLIAGDDVLGCRITREANKYMAGLCKEYPSRFGFFAALPLPNVTGSLDEIDYALDVLGAMGFALMTNVHGLYPGDERVSKIFDRLNERKAIVFFHPTNCHHVPLDGSAPQITAPLALPGGVLEYVFDTTRAVTSLLTSNTITRTPDIKYIIPHCGGTLSTILERIAGFTTKILKQPNAMTATQIKEVFKTQFYFDLAGFPFPDQLPALMSMTDTSHLLYGTDFPYLQAPLVTELAEAMTVGLEGMFDQENREKIYWRNAEKLLGQ